MEYSYCGENTSEVDLEVVRVVDDRYGTLEVPEEETILSPGETLCNTDLGLPVTYVARPADAGTTIVNNAVVTVRTVGAEPQAFQAADPAEVEILAVGDQVDPTTTALPPTRLASTGASSVPLGLVVSAGMVASGSLILVAARRRRTESDGSKCDFSATACGGGSGAAGLVSGESRYSGSPAGSVGAALWVCR